MSCAPSSNPAARDIQVVGINDLGPVETNAHLLRYDCVHGRFPAKVTVYGDTIDVGTGPIKVTAIKDPSALPHKELGVDIAHGMHRHLHRPRQGRDAAGRRRQARAGLRARPTAPISPWSMASTTTS